MKEGAQNSRKLPTADFPPGCARSFRLGDDYYSFFFLFSSVLLLLAVRSDGLSSPALLPPSPPVSSGRSLTLIHTRMDDGAHNPRFRISGCPLRSSTRGGQEGSPDRASSPVEKKRINNFGNNPSVEWRTGDRPLQVLSAQRAHTELTAYHLVNRESRRSSSLLILSSSFAPSCVCRYQHFNVARRTHTPAPPRPAACWRVRCYLAKGRAR